MAEVKIMANKYHRQNFANGTPNPLAMSRKTNIQKIAEVFGPKKTKIKKDKKPKKRMMANKGGGADAAKPDFLDLDKDGNKEESMKLAAAQARKTAKKEAND